MQIDARRNKILQLIKERQIETQEEMAAALISEGCKVTQATISRDIKELGLIKVAAGSGKQYYAKESGLRQVASKVADIAYSGINSINVCEKTVIIKVAEGLGRVVKSSIEFSASCIGSVADDDTVLAIFADEGSAIDFYKRLSAMIMY